jgi:hypothetical protein
MSDTLIETPEAIPNQAFVEVSLADKIPNNVDLANDRQLLRAMEAWQPNYLEWWKEIGPEGLLGHPAGAEGRRPHYSLRQAQGRAGLAGSAR